MNILFAGEGGQGVQLIGEVLAKSAFLENKESLYIPNFGVEQRGGISLAFVVISLNKVVYPKFDKADILAILCDRAYDRIKNYISPETIIFIGPAVKKISKYIKAKKTIFVKPTWFPPKVWNILVLASILGQISIVSKNSVKISLEEKLKSKFEKDQMLKELDLRALGYQM